MKIAKFVCLPHFILGLHVILIQPVFGFFNIVKEYKQFVSEPKKKLLLLEQQEKNDRLYRSIINENLSEIKKAVVDGGDINTHDNFPPLFCTLHRSEEIVTYLLDQGANPNMRNGYGEIALMRVIELKKYNLLKQFLEHPAIDVTISSHKSETIWHYAMRFYDPTIFTKLYADHRCRALLAKISDNLLFDFVHYQQEHPDFYALLVQLIALPEIAKNITRKRSGDTILQAIVRASDLIPKKQCIMLLLHWFPAIDIWHRDWQGLTAYQLSKKLKESTDIQLLLLQYMKSDYEIPKSTDIRWHYWD